MRSSFLAVAVLLVTLTVAAADTLILKDGRRFEGNVIASGGGVVKFKTAGGVVEFPEKDVERIEKGATKADDYAARRKAVADGDLKGLLELARWCGEQKLVAQRKRLLAEIVKAVPDHPEARRELGQVFRDGKWVDAGGPVPAPKVEPGERTSLPESALSLAFPKGWTVKVETSRASATGPAAYASPPVLTVEFGPPASPPAEFAGEDGWEKPAEAAAAGLTGLRTRRTVAEGGIDRREFRAILSGPRGELRMGLTCLALEAEVFAEALELALRTAALAPPKADYVNTHYKYQCDMPKPADEWEFGEDEEHDLVHRRKNEDATGFAVLAVVTGNAGEEASQVEQRFSNRFEMLKAMGDVKRDEEIDFAGEKARFVEATYLDDGIPSLMRLLRLAHQGRVYLLEFDRHEFGKTDAGWDAVFASFRFTE